MAGAGGATPEKRNGLGGGVGVGGPGGTRANGEFCFVELPTQVRADPETKCYRFILEGKCWVLGKESQPLGL